MKKRFISIHCTNCQVLQQKLLASVENVFDEFSVKTNSNIRVKIILKISLYFSFKLLSKDFMPLRNITSSGPETATNGLFKFVKIRERRWGAFNVQIS